MSIHQPVLPGYHSRCYNFRFVRYIYKKCGASSVPGPRCKGLRITLIVQPSNAKSPTLICIQLYTAYVKP